MLKKEESRREKRLSFSDDKRGRIWNNYMDKIINKEDSWSLRPMALKVEITIERIIFEEVEKAIKETKPH